jgi:hypothetical protein
MTSVAGEGKGMACARFCQRFYQPLKNLKIALLFKLNIWWCGGHSLIIIKKKPIPELSVGI